MTGKGWHFRTAASIAVGALLGARACTGEGGSESAAQGIAGSGAEAGGDGISSGGSDDGGGGEAGSPHSDAGSNGSGATSNEGGSGGELSEGGAGGSGEGHCDATPVCDTAAPVPVSQEWRHASSAIAAGQGPRHRGRDLLLNPGDAQWVLAKFAYGVATDIDLVDEDVEIYLLRGCGTSWEDLGTAATTDDGDHAAVEGIADTGGRIYFKIPSNKALGLGRHRVHLVVLGDLTTTELFIDVVPDGSPVLVSDVDGTLTTNETTDFTALGSGPLPEATSDAATALQTLADKGYHPVYLTARPEWLTQQTRQFLETNAFPPGVIHTTTTQTGAIGQEEADFKSDELAELGDDGMLPGWVFGNGERDAAACEDNDIQPLDQRVFFQYTDAQGGRRIESYGELLPDLAALPSLCE